MSKKRRRYSAEYKFKVALEAAKGTKTLLYEQIGRLKMELEWLKKKLPASTEAMRAMIEPHHPDISIRRHSCIKLLSSLSSDITAIALGWPVPSGRGRGHSVG